MGTKGGTKARAPLLDLAPCYAEQSRASGPRIGRANCEQRKSYLGHELAAGLVICFPGPGLLPPQLLSMGLRAHAPRIFFLRPSFPSLGLGKGGWAGWRRRNTLSVDSNAAAASAARRLHRSLSLPPHPSLLQAPLPGKASLSGQHLGHILISIDLSPLSNELPFRINLSQACVARGVLRLDSRDRIIFPLCRHLALVCRNHIFSCTIYFNFCIWYN